MQPWIRTRRRSCHDDVCKTRWPHPEKCQRSRCVSCTARQSGNKQRMHDPPRHEPGAARCSASPKSANVRGFSKVRLAPASIAARAIMQLARPASDCPQLIDRLGQSPRVEHQREHRLSNITTNRQKQRKVRSSTPSRRRHASSTPRYCRTALSANRPDYQP